MLVTPSRVIISNLVEVVSVGKSVLSYYQRMRISGTHLFSCLTKLAKLQCLKCLGSMFFVKSLVCSTISLNELDQFRMIISHINNDKTITSLTPSDNLPMRWIL